MDQLVPIGHFSKMTRLSIKALRLYGELGLLDPARVDPSSGYRYYRLGQANRAEAIRVLREVDMPLDSIAEVLATTDRELAAKHLGQHRDRLAARLADDERKLRFLERLIERGESIMPYDITAKRTDHTIAATTRRTTDLAGIGETLADGFGAAMHAVSAAGGMPAGPPFVVYHDLIDEQTVGSIEIGIPVAAGLDLNGDVAVVDLEPTTVASTIHRGPYDEIRQAYHALSAWMAEQGREPAGPPREIYLNDPGEVPPPELLTEVQWPVAPGA